MKMFCFHSANSRIKFSLQRTRRFRKKSILEPSSCSFSILSSLFKRSTKSSKKPQIHLPHIPFLPQSASSAFEDVTLCGFSPKNAKILSLCLLLLPNFILNYLLQQTL